MPVLTIFINNFVGEFILNDNEDVHIIFIEEQKQIPHSLNYCAIFNVF